MLIAHLNYALYFSYFRFFAEKYGIAIATKRPAVLMHGRPLLVRWLTAIRSALFPTHCFWHSTPAAPLPGWALEGQWHGKPCRPPPKGRDRFPSNRPCPLGKRGKAAMALYQAARRLSISDVAWSPVPHGQFRAQGHRPTPIRDGQLHQVFRHPAPP